MIAGLAPVLLAAISGVSAWLSFGVFAVSGTSPLTRVGAVPPFWMLAVLILLAVGIVAVARPLPSRLWPLTLTLLIWLPWLPGRVPPAFLLWHGAAVWLVWLAVFAGLLWGAPGEWTLGPRRVLLDPHRAPLASAVLAAVLYLAGAWALQARLPAGDEPHYLIITQSLLNDGDLRIENNHDRGDYHSYYQSELRPDFLRRGLNGAIYSIHAPGVSVLVLPFFAVAGYAGALLAVVCVVAAGFALLWQALWLLTGSAMAAWAGWASVALTAPVFFHAFTIYPDGAGAAITAVGVWLLVRLDRSGASKASMRALLLVGGALAALPWLHTRFSIIAGVLGLAIAARMVSASDRWRRLGAFLVVPVVSAACWLGYFWLIWGTADPAAPYGHYTQSTLSQLKPGIPGLLVDQQFGLIANAPVYAVALLGLWPMLRYYPRLTFELLALVVPYLLAVASYRMWWGGYSAPARLLVSILPIAALPIAVLWQRATGPALRALTLALLLLSMAIIVPRTLVDEGVLLYNGRDGFDLLLDWMNRSVDLTRAMPSLHRDSVTDATMDAAVWAAGGALLVGMLVLTLNGRTRSRGASWAVVGLSGATVLMVVVTIVWHRRGIAAVTPNTSALELLQDWRPDIQSQGWQSRPFRLLSAADMVRRIELSSTSRGPAPQGVVPFFQAPLVPAGDYDIAIKGPTRLSGELTVEVGRTDQRLETFGLDGVSSGFTGLTLHLPVRAHSVTIRGDDAARTSITRLVLRPRELRARADRLSDRYAQRATRYGRVRAFFVDDNAFMEPGGFWTRGNDDTDVVVDADEGATAQSLTVRVRTGAVATTVALSTDGWDTFLTLSAGEQRDVILPALVGADARRLLIRTGTGFRPNDYEPTNRDMRNLGVWVEFPATPAQ